MRQLLSAPGVNNSGRDNAIKRTEANYQLTQNKLDTMSEILISAQSKNQVRGDCKGASALLAEYTAAQITPTNDTAINSHTFNSSTYAQISANESLNKSAIIEKLREDGLATTPSLVLGGYDYHGNDLRNQDNKEQEAGETVEVILEIAALKSSLYSLLSPLTILSLITEMDAGLLVLNLTMV